MNTIFKQDARLGRLLTSLGPEALVLTRFDGTDKVNTPYEYRVEALSTDPEVDFDAVIGTHASVEIQSLAHGAQWFDGIVTKMQCLGSAKNGVRYDLTLRPWAWLASRRRNQRIFHEKSVVEILEELLSTYAGLGDPHLENRLTRDYAPIEYVVQYREDDLSFATRMMERFGISYHFTHAEGSHTMVLTDAIEEHQPIAGGARPYKGADGHYLADEEHFWSWKPERNMTTGAVRLIDYNFKAPTAAMEVDRIGDAAHAMGQIESFDYPGDYLDQSQGKDVAALRTAQERGRDARHKAEGNCMSLRAGMTVMLTGDAAPGAVPQPYLCLAASHLFEGENYGSGGEADEQPYRGTYTLMPATAPLAPRRKTPMPTVQGPQTAKVVGEGEIDCDEFGRILVQFHWDLEGAKSMRCRVSQNWAHGGWGGMVIPRIGMEVVVEFLDGDPDKPIVTGCVYNSKNMPAQGLPAAKTKSGFKTKSHEGEGFNEMTFEDQSGREEIFVHAQKDLNRVILDNESTFLRDGNRQVKLQTGDEAKEIVSGNLSEDVAKTRSLVANTVRTEAKKGKGAAGAPGEIKSEADDLISMEAGEKIVLKVGDGTIEMTKTAIVLDFKGSRITLTEDIIDQLATAIHLNKDTAG